LAGAYWLALGTNFSPQYNTWGAYATDPTNAASGLKTEAFNASFGFFFLAMGLLCFIYLICSIRTNIVFVGIFTSLVPAFGCLAGVYWQAAQGNAVAAGKLEIAAGALLFITCALGWWIFLAIMLASLDHPLQLPGKHSCSPSDCQSLANCLQWVISPASSRVRVRRLRPELRSMAWFEPQDMWHNNIKIRYVINRKTVTLQNTKEQ
jgi:hypothetical protein